MFKDTVLTMVQMALEDHVNDVFTAIQSELGITSGDAEPMDFWQLDTIQTMMADTIAGIIAKQARNSAPDGVRVFYDNEAECIITENEVRTNYIEFEQGRGEYASFGEYLNACMDYNNGALTEI